MKHETPTIAALPRDRCGSRYSQRLRKEGRLPAVIYGHKTTPVAVSVNEEEVLKQISHGVHAMYVDVEGGKKETCLVKDLQYGFLGDNVIHVDFARVDLEEEVSVQVHIVFVGTAAESLKADTILRHDQTELNVRCKVNAIPEEIKVDLSAMDGTQLTAAEIPLPEGLVLAENPTQTIASVSYLRVAEAEETGEEAEVTADGAEPEVITEAKAEGGDGAGGDSSS